MTATGPEPCAQPLLDRHDALLLDIDGVVQLGDQPVPQAGEVLARVRRRGTSLAFVTNNASRPPEDVAGRLRALGVAAAADEVVTSALAAADVLAAGLAPGTPVLVVGGVGLRSAVAAAGLTVVRSADEAPAAVVQGWSPDLTWADLAEGAVALRAGARWVVSNRDLTLPSPRGPLPGSGSMVAALVAATGREPDVVVGKPQPELFTIAAHRLAAHRPLVVGDRLDTDIAGARAAGLRSLLVLTGVTDARQVLAAGPAARPEHLGADLTALEHPHPGVTVSSAGARCGGVTVTRDGRVERDRTVDDGDRLDGLRAAAALAWSGELHPERYDTVLRELHLDRTSRVTGRTMTAAAAGPERSP